MGAIFPNSRGFVLSEERARLKVKEQQEEHKEEVKIFS
jgi:hypothetical protein